MKKSIQFFIALALLFGFGISAMAQQFDDGQISAQAEVSALVSVTPVDNLVFGMVTPGNTKTISSAGEVIVGTVGSGTTLGAEQAGQFSVSKGFNTEVILEFDLPTNLIFDVTNTMPINFDDVVAVKLAKLAAFNGTEAEVPFTPASGITTLNAGSTVDYFADNDFYVFIGGTVVPALDQDAGVYEGTITLTATYN
jgi:hypothetical protein